MWCVPALRSSLNVKRWGNVCGKYPSSHSVCSPGGCSQELTGRVQPGLWRTSHGARLSCLCVHLPGLRWERSSQTLRGEPHQERCHSEQVREPVSLKKKSILRLFSMFFTHCVMSAGCWISTLVRRQSPPSWTRVCPRTCRTWSARPPRGFTWGARGTSTCVGRSCSRTSTAPTTLRPPWAACTSRPSTTPTVSSTASPSSTTAPRTCCAWAGTTTPPNTLRPQR